MKVFLCKTSTIKSNISTTNSLQCARRWCCLWGIPVLGSLNSSMASSKGLPVMLLHNVVAFLRRWSLLWLRKFRGQALKWELILLGFFFERIFVSSSGKNGKSGAGVGRNGLMPITFDCIWFGCDSKQSNSRVKSLLFWRPLAVLSVQIYSLLPIIGI